MLFSLTMLIFHEVQKIIKLILFGPIENLLDFYQNARCAPTCIPSCSVLELTLILKIWPLLDENELGIGFLYFVFFEITLWCDTAMFRLYRGVKDFRIDLSMGIRNKNYAIQPRKFIMTSHGSDHWNCLKVGQGSPNRILLSISDIGDCSWVWRLTSITGN